LSCLNAGALGFSAPDEPAIRIVHSSDARSPSSDVNAHVAADVSSAAFESINYTFKEIAMKKTMYALTLAALVAFIVPVASADDTSAAKPRSAKIQTAAIKVDAPVASGKASQQDKMRTCSKQATGKKGDERKAFMKGCLSKKKA
jgi:hypothetical protein